MSVKLAIRLFGLGKQSLKCVAPELFRRNKYVSKTLTAVLIHEPSRCQFSTDSLDNKHIIVYKGPLSRQILRVKLFSLMTSMSGVIAQPLIMERAAELGSSTSTIVLICTFVGFFTFVTPLLLHYVTKKYVTSVLYDVQDDSYIATTYSLFLRDKELRLKPGEAVLPDVVGMFTSISVRGTPLFIDAKHFTDVNHYKRIMGFDKPLDFKLSTDSTSTKKD